jgi:hypothetical protein
MDAGVFTRCHGFDVIFYADVAAVPLAFHTLDVQVAVHQARIVSANQHGCVRGMALGIQLEGAMITEYGQIIGVEKGFACAYPKGVLQLSLGTTHADNTCQKAEYGLFHGV